MQVVSVHNISLGWCPATGAKPIARTLVLTLDRLRGRGGGAAVAAGVLFHSPVGSQLLTFPSEGLERRHKIPKAEEQEHAACCIGDRHARNHALLVTTMTSAFSKERNYTRRAVHRLAGPTQYEPSKAVCISSW